MSLDKNLVLFGKDEAYVAVLTEDSATARTYDATTGLVRLEAIQDIKISEVSNEYVLQGDNGTKDVRTVTEAYDVEITYGISTLEQYKLFKNADLVETDDGMGNITKRELKFKSSDKPGYLGFISVVQSAGLKVVLPKLKVVSMEIPYSNLTHSVVTVKAKALKSDYDKVMQKLIQEDPDTMAAASLTDLN